MKPHVKLCVASCLLDAALLIGVTSMPFYVYHVLGGGVAMSGSIGAAQSAVYAAACLFSSRKLVHHRHAMRFAALGGLFFCWVFAFAHLVPIRPIYPYLAAGAVLGMALYWPVTHSWFGAEPDPRKRGRLMAMYNVSWSVGLACGPIIGGWLYDIDYQLPFFVMLALGAMTAAIVWTVPREEDQYEAAPPELLAGRVEHDRLAEVYLWGSLVGNAVAWALVGITRMVFPKRIDELVAAGELMLFGAAPLPEFLAERTATLYSIMSFSLATSTAIVFFVMGHTHRWHHKFWFFALLQGLGAAAFWVLGSSTSLIVLAAAFVIVGVSSGANYFASAYYCMAHSGRRRGRVAINEFTVGVGAFVGPLTFGLAAEKYGAGTPFLYTPWIISAALAVQLGLNLLRRNART